MAVSLAAVSLGLLTSQAEEADKEGAENTSEPKLQEAADPMLGALDLSDTRRGNLMEELKELHSGGEGPVWSEGFSKNLSGDGAGMLRQMLLRHGFSPQDLEWIVQLPQDTPADVRTSVLILHSRQLLREGPARFEGHWSEWDEGDTPGSDPEEEKKEVSELREMAEQAGDDPATLLEAFVPKNHIYTVLQQELAQREENLDRMRDDFVPMPRIKDGDIVKAGDSYEGVPLLTRRLKEEGYLDSAPAEASEGEEASTVYTEELAEAVKVFQERHGRTVDGILGPNTLAELNRGPEVELELLRINLHRSRILPNEPGERFVIANVPSTTVHAFEKDSEKPVLGMKTIVGEVIREKQTPVFRDIMETLEFGPYWNVPTSIASRSIIPKARNNHSYLANNNYEIVSSYGSSETISVSSDSLSKVDSGALLIHQKPGPKNALGSVKFLFPNDYAIYLHDTPDDSLFSEAQRDFSNGCIRVEKPADLAEWILGPQGWDRSRVDEALESGENKRVSVEDKVNVYIVYLTAYPTWDGNEGQTVRFHPDLYERDKEFLKENENAD